ncbi:MAG: hypothetical protein HGA63_08310, partial [Syntrophobacteraceae bacterium]|nr:hypothetical protein [Syntrophobacteraceae bacterium]
VFVACGALRLARFNVQVETVSKKYFVGLPIPGAASMVAATVLFFHELRLLTVVGSKLPLLLLTYILGFLMVSTVPYYSFKDFEMLKARPFPVFFGILVLVTVIAMRPELTLFFLLVVYLFSGPVIYLVRLYREGRSDRQSPPPEAAMLEDGAGGQERRSGVLAEVVEDDKK